MRYLCMAVRAREPYVAYLQHNIPGLEVIWDTERSGVATLRALLKAAGDDPIVLLEDDICIARGFTRKVEAAITEHPGDVIQFHSRSKKDAETLKAGLNGYWRAGATFLNHQAVYLPAGMARTFLTCPASNAVWDAGTHSTDTGTQASLKHNGIRYWNHVPTLAEHLPIPSQMGPRSKARQSATFTNPETQGLPVDVMQWVLKAYGLPKKDAA